MKELSKPSKAVGSKVLAKVPFQDRFIGYLLSERHGATRVTAYSFEEILNLLHDSMPRVDFEALKEWVREVMGDDELANGIAEAVVTETNDQARTLRIRNLMRERLAQCKTITLAEDARIG